MPADPYFFLLAGVQTCTHLLPSVMTAVSMTPGESSSDPQGLVCSWTAARKLGSWKDGSRPLDNYHHEFCSVPEEEHVGPI